MNEKGLPPEILEKLQAQYRESLPTRLKLIREAIDALKQAATQENIKGLKLLVHKLAGNAGTYGYNNVTNICLIWDQKLLHLLEKFPHCNLDSLFFTEMEDLFKQVQNEFEVN